MFGLTKKILSALSLLTLFNPINTLNSVLPVAVLHGVESSSEKMIPFCDWIGTSFNVKVFNIEIGNGEKTSMYTPLSKQLEEL